MKPFTIFKNTVLEGTFKFELSYILVPATAWTEEEFDWDNIKEESMPTAPSGASRKSLTPSNSNAPR